MISFGTLTPLKMTQEGLRITEAYISKYLSWYADMEQKLHKKTDFNKNTFLTPETSAKIM